MSGRRGAWLDGALFALGAALLVAGHARDALRPRPYEPAPRGDALVRIATWNIGTGLASDSRALEDDELARVAAALVELDADLILLQEVDGRRALGDLRRALGPEWRSAMARGTGGRRVAALGRGELESFPVSGERGRTLGVRFRSGSEDEVVAVVLHAHAFSAEERNERIAEALEHLRAQEARGLRVLAGDLNLDLDLDKRRDLFTDDAHLDVETYNYVARYLDDAAAGRGTTAEPDRRLDYVFYESSAYELAAAGPWKGRRIGDMDHDPVAADFVPRSE